MSEPRVVVRKEARRPKKAKPWGEGATFKVVGWVGLVFALAALGDFALAFYPLGFGSPEWEIATVSQVVQELPLLSFGLVGVWVCAGGLGARRLLIVVGVALAAVAVIVLFMLVLLATDVPIALRATQQTAVARAGIIKLVAKTVFLGVLFTVSYAVAGAVALRQARGGSSA